MPAIVGARTATTVLRDGELVTVDGAKGEVLEGADARGIRRWRTRRPSSRPSPRPRRRSRSPRKLYVNLAIAERAEDVAALDVDGVGLLRAEFMITDALGGLHPREMLARGQREEFVAAHERVAAHGHACVRRAAGRVPHDRLPHATSSAGSRAASGSSRRRTTR